MNLLAGSSKIIEKKDPLKELVMGKLKIFQAMFLLCFITSLALPSRAGANEQQRSNDTPNSIDDCFRFDDDDDDDSMPCDGCLINGACYGNGQTNPDNHCEICDAFNAGDDWTDNDGALCNDGLFCNGVDTCSGGSC